MVLLNLLPLWRLKLLLLVLEWAPLSAQGITVAVPLTPPSSAPVISRSLISFSLEQDRWSEWIGQSPGNPFFLNTLNNLKALTGEPARIRIGGNSVDRTNFNPSVQVCSVPHLFGDQFPAISSTVPYPEATVNVVGANFYALASSLPSGSSVVWGVNFGQNNLTAAFLEATAIANAFASTSFQNSKITLEAIEIGNEADLYTSNGLRDGSFNVQKYVTQWTTFAENVTTTVNKILATKVPLQGAAFAGSSHAGTTGFSPQAIFQNNILSSSAGSQIKLISQHHYSGSFCSGTASLLQDLMSKASIRDNLKAFAPDIAAVQQKGLTYVLGETNSFADTAGAAVWGLDYALYAAQLGITRVYFHQGIGFKYNFIQPISLTRSILDGSQLAQSLPPHIQPLYYAAIIAAEAIGPSGSTHIVELTLNSTQISGYAVYESSALVRAVFINSVAFTSGTRGSAHLALDFSGTGKRPTSAVVKRLSIPTANATKGVTWGGQTYETQDGKVAGSLSTLTVPVSQGVDIHDTEVVLLTFS
ncbi:glycoside hydrolase family 79 protein [Russula brevipes]|nr:glycoside hydrolase family 79 protein [Russula brevipes]